MPRLSTRLVLTALLLVGGAVAYGILQPRAGQREWAEIRSLLPIVDETTAPGLTARLAAATARLDASPTDRTALAELAQLCHANGFAEAALPAYRALAALDPAEGRWPYQSAVLLAGQGWLDEALPLYGRAAELAPQQPIVWQRLGDALLKSNRTEEARRAYESALALRPGSVHALFGLARCDLQDGRLTAARSRLTQAAATDPAFAGAPSLLATVCERLGLPEAAAAARARVRGDGRYTEAPDPWAIVLRDYCHTTYTLLLAAGALTSDGEPAAAIPLLVRAQALAPHDPAVLRQLGHTRSRLGDDTGARAALEQALALAPADEKIRSDLLTLLRSARDDAAAARVAADGLRFDPENPAWLFVDGLQAERNGRTDDAAARFAAVWRLRPDETAAPCRLAALHFGAGRPEAALAVLEALLTAHPEDTGALTLLVQHGIATRDPRTAAWLERAQRTAGGPARFADLRQAYQRRFGQMP